MSPKKKMTIDEFQTLPKEEREKILGKSTRAAIKRLHDVGLPSVHGDDKGTYYLYPDGRKEYIRADKKHPRLPQEVLLSIISGCIP